MEGDYNIPPPLPPPDRPAFGPDIRHTVKNRDRSRSRKRDEFNKKPRPDNQTTPMDVTNQNEIDIPNNSNNKTTSITVTPASQKVGDNQVNYNFRYDTDHKGPYYVYFDKTSADGSIEVLNSLMLSRLIKSSGIPGVLDVNKIGFGRAKVICRTGTDANNIAADPILAQQGYVEIPIEEIRATIQSEKEILNIVRLTRKNGNEIVDTTRIKITFKGLDIPKTVRLFDYTNRDVKHYVSFGQCYNCFRFNHFSGHCKQAIENCRKCYVPHQNSEPCAAEIKCSNCKGDHSPLDRGCPARETAYQIKRIMTIENLNQKEARLRYASVFNSNRFDILADNIDATFPQLTKTFRKSKTSGQNVINNTHGVLNNTQEAVKDLHAINPYAKVIKNNKNRLREEANVIKTRQEHKKALEEGEVYQSVNGSALNNIQKVSELEKFLSNIVKDIKTIKDSDEKSFSNNQLRILNNLKDKIEGQLIDLECYIIKTTTPDNPDSS
ncbi:uncharacterized protein isoform X2 [Musca autumnalis]|uniref:uncharacterized protein isoform X2 n=1 Tax=Musca autumnalis TaxID=221902 RepID=UPI003CF40C99